MHKPADLKILFRALEFSAHKHRNQRRKDVHTTPYINHPIMVAGFLAKEADIHDIDILCAALLHDTIEDTRTTAQELVELFGDRVCAIVQEVTDDKSLEKSDRKQAQIDHAPQLSREARAVKLADKTCNLSDVINYPPADWSLQRRQAYFDWGKQVVDGLRGEWPDLEELFDAQYANRPVE